MSREWFAVQSRIVRLPKFRTLSRTAQLTLVYAWALAGDQDIEASWPDRDALIATLELHGLSKPMNDIDELTAGGWLDLSESGDLSIHDWDEHQWAASKAARNRWEAKYMRDWRAEKRKDAATTQDRKEQKGHNRSKQRVDNASSTETDEGGLEIVKPSCDVCHDDLIGEPWKGRRTNDGKVVNVHDRCFREAAA